MKEINCVEMLNLSLILKFDYFFLNLLTLTEESASVILIPKSEEAK
jgi:hypothetical protein